ncbi:hypothetical protein QTP88_024417 [Uroleucon formosanum]
MPKVKTPIRSRLQTYVNDHKDIFKTDGSILYCNICEIPVNATTKFLVDQHLSQSKDYLLSEAMIKIKNAKTTLKLSKNKIESLVIIIIPIIVINTVPVLSTIECNITYKLMGKNRRSKLPAPILEKMYEKEQLLININNIIK